MRRGPKVGVVEGAGVIDPGGVELRRLGVRSVAMMSRRMPRLRE